MLMEVEEAQGVLTRGSAKVRDGIQRTFRVSGIGRRVPGSGVQVRVQVQDLNFAPAPAPAPDNPYLRPEGRDLRPESVSLWPTGPLVNESTNFAIPLRPIWQSSPLQFHPHTDYGAGNGGRIRRDQKADG